MSEKKIQIWCKSLPPHNKNCKPETNGYILSLSVGLIWISEYASTLRTKEKIKNKKSI